MVHTASDRESTTDHDTRQTGGMFTCRIDLIRDPPASPSNLHPPYLVTRNVYSGVLGPRSWLGPQSNHVRLYLIRTETLFGPYVTVSPIRGSDERFIFNLPKMVCRSRSDAKGAAKDSFYYGP